MSAPRKLEVLVAGRRGGARSPRATGLPIVMVDAVHDAGAALAKLNAPASDEAPATDPTARPAGRGRWRRLPWTGPGPRARAPGVDLAGGRMIVTLPPDVAPSKFREGLRDGLRHLRLADAASPRASIRARASGRSRPCRPVADLYVVDPARDAWRLFWIVEAARLTAVQRSGCGR